MHSDLHLHLAHAAGDERLAAAARAARALAPLAELAPRPDRGADAVLALRRAAPDEAGAVRRLAALDGVPELRDPVLLALVDGEPVAAVSLADGRVAADPFRHTADAVALLRVRAAQPAVGGRRERARRGLARRARVRLAA